MGLEEKGANYRLVRMGPGQTKHPDHLARNPFGRIPVLEHDDFSLYETQAILRYLDAILPEPALRPADPRAAARMDQLVGIVDWYFFKQISATIGFHRIVAPHFGMPTDEAVIADAVPKARPILMAIDTIMGDNAFLTGTAISIADLMLAPHLDFLAMTPEGVELLAPHPRLAAWLALMRSRDSMARTGMDRLLKQAA